MLNRFLYIINFRKPCLLEPIILEQSALISLILGSLPHIDVVCPIVCGIRLAEILHEMGRRIVSGNRGSDIYNIWHFDWLIIILRGLINRLLYYLLS